MSFGEIIGLLLTVALFACALGVSAAAVVAGRRYRRQELAVRRVDAYAHWLGARITITRASISFVAAFRALALERGDGAALALRRDEAQRTRAAWCAAQRELDRAEAMLVAWSGDPAVRQRVRALGHVAPEALRRAIHADAQDAGEFFVGLREADERATDLVAEMTEAIHVPRVNCGRIAERVRVCLAFVADSMRRI